MIDLFDTFVQLQQAARPSGLESPCAKLLAQWAAPLCDEVAIDPLGNVICHKKGPGKKLMMVAHMDVIGLLVTHIDEQGFLRFACIGGFTPYRLIGTRVRLESGLCGCVCCDEKAAAKPAGQVKAGDLYIDIGAKGREEAQKLVQIGDVAMYEGDPVQVNGKVIGPYCDDLIACAALLKAMELVENSENDLYFVFAVQEEVGLRGAQVASYGIEPDYGYCMDVTRTGDCPAEKAKMIVALGKGPAIKIKDSSLLCNPQAVAALRRAAEENGIAYQDEVLTAGGTDSAAMQQSKAGVLAGCISIPCRYIHSPNEMVSLQDVEQCARLMALAAGQAL